MTERKSSQFTIGRLMVLTCVVAVVMTISIQFKVSIVAQGLFAAYLFLLIGWGVMRGPSVISDLLDVNKKRLKVIENRQELERELRERIFSKSKDPKA